MEPDKQDTARHTEGPWEALESRVQVSADLHITNVVSANLTHAEDIANARLIAAAPTMYDYLTRLAEGGDNEAHEIIKGIDG